MFFLFAFADVVLLPVNCLFLYLWLLVLWLTDLTDNVVVLLSLLVYLLPVVLLFLSVLLSSYSSPSNLLSPLLRLLLFLLLLVCVFLLSFVLCFFFCLLSVFHSSSACTRTHILYTV